MEEEAKREKLVVVATHGGEDPERASLPFVVANAALVMDVESAVILQSSAVTLTAKGCYEHVFAPGLPPLKDLVDSFLEQGGALLVCTPCLEERKIDKASLIEGAVPVKAGRVVMEVMEATSTLSY
ncbi:MAG: DsrE family protein [Acidobacteriota bacterium]|jgi:predicted peroxiredoxin